MKGYKLITRKEFTQENRDFELYKYEVLDTNITLYDVTWIFNEIMNDDEEKAFLNGIFLTPRTITCLNCEDVYNAFLDFEKEEDLQDFSETFQKDFYRIKERMREYRGFEIYCAEEYF